MDAKAWDERYQGADLLWTAEPNRFLVDEVTSLDPGTALDLACGEGRNAVWLAEQGWWVTAVDFSPVGLGKARQLADHRGVEVEWAQADVREWEPEAATFDLVVWLYLHLPQPLRQAVLESAASGMAPGGTLLVVGHHVDNLEHGYGGPPDPEILLDPETIASELAGANPNLTIERADRVLRPVATDDGERIAVDALVRAHRPD